MSGGIFERKVESPSGVYDKSASGERVLMTSGTLTMGADAVVTVRVVMAAGPLTRCTYVVVGSSLVAVTGYADLRLVE